MVRFHDRLSAVHSTKGEMMEVINHIMFAFSFFSCHFVIMFNMTNPDEGFEVNITSVGKRDRKFIDGITSMEGREGVMNTLNNIENMIGKLCYAVSLGNDFLASEDFIFFLVMGDVYNDVDELNNDMKKIRIRIGKSYLRNLIYRKTLEEVEDNWCDEMMDRILTYDMREDEKIDCIKGMLTLNRHYTNIRDNYKGEKVI